MLKKQRRVSFAETHGDMQVSTAIVLVLDRSSYSPLELEACWYTRQDYVDICHQAQEEMIHHHPPISSLSSSSSTAAAATVETIRSLAATTFRGLPISMTQEMEKFQRIQKVRRNVLKEQQHKQQQKELLCCNEQESDLEPSMETRLATASLDCTSQSKIEAFLRGGSDARIARDIYDQEAEQEQDDDNDDDTHSETNGIFKASHSSSSSSSSHSGRELGQSTLLLRQQRQRRRHHQQQQQQQQQQYQRPSSSLLQRLQQSCPQPTVVLSMAA